MEKILVQLKEADENYETEYGKTKIDKRAIRSRNKDDKAVLQEGKDSGIYDANENGDIQVIQYVAPSMQSKSYHT